MTLGSQIRGQAYAAHPGEHVLSPAVISTFFPHLPARNALPFRIALVIGLGLLILLGATGFTGPSIAAAALFLPLLYLVYLYEVDVYGDGSPLAIGLLFGSGILVGLGWARLTSGAVTQTVVQGSTMGLSASDVIRFGIVIPLAAQALMLVVSLGVYQRRQYDEVLDGFASGVAAALGFTLAVTIFNLWPELSHGMFSSSPTLDRTLIVVGRGLLVPFISASATGLLAGALWLRRNQARSSLAYGWAASLRLLVPLIALLWVLLGLVNLLILSIPVVVAVYAVAAIVLLLLVRVTLHHMLLAEAVKVRIGPDTVCFHCHSLVPRMAFCEQCGVATRSTPKRGGGRLFRTFR
jgi:RsiW-degrading membrane proteinase PrsW (M82 family)